MDRRREHGTGLWLEDEIDELLAGPEHEGRDENGLGREYDELRPWFFRDLAAELGKR